MSAPTPGGGQFDPETLVSEVDALLASDAAGQEEAVLLEQAHRAIADALEGR